MGATSFKTRTLETSTVTIHSTVRVRPRIFFDTFSHTSFNSRTREGATFQFFVPYRLLDVSIHAPVRVRLQTSETATSPLGFNSRTREGATHQQFVL